MSRVLESAGYAVRSTDLIDRGFGNSAVDFLLEQSPADNIVTNPPFKLVEEFIRQSVRLAHRKVAILGRLGLLEGQERRKIWNDTPFSRVWVFSRRIAFLKPGEDEYGSKGGKGGMVPYAWYVWDRDYVGRPQIGWI